ncbi:histidine phosphatase family protein [Pseudoroseicyclus tamaricis]|uniref:Histidine phosphatase family protein n=1 Tax=Pseudoroseicyclus tamaricis TaxID=2705421 RepID=A0A6B2K0Q9_9RHOB|nr:histidine phosphatase family protein [Pseudoroseicyclus tamaricis]NDV01272.1 histidine phosphatase family protein [Pseudoroseicyclus tamaricis]
MSASPAPVITLVRHGQAQTGARDEASYDRLSEQGERQARWLGAHLAQSGEPVRRLVSGSLARQRQTAALIGAELGLEPEEDPRLDELDYFGLAEAANRHHALPFPTDRASFLSHMPQVMAAWAEERIGTPRESFAAFEFRIAAALAEAGQGAHGPGPGEEPAQTMLVTSGGVIAMALKVAMGLGVHAFSHVALQIENTSMHRLVPGPDHLRLDLFNATPHLSTRDRRPFRSHT